MNPAKLTVAQLKNELKERGLEQTVRAGGCFRGCGTAGAASQAAAGTRKRWYDLGGHVSAGCLDEAAGCVRTSGNTALTAVAADARRLPATSTHGRA
jgi:sulfite reductase beta subunit-like hemoprotein